MAKRKLKRQLSLLQVIMLGTAGTIAAEIFVLTGHAAGRAGPAAVLATLLAGILSYTVALDYCELATTYPVTGGALTYVREAFGPNLLAFLVGSLDCLSSTFYCALSAVGFAYSLQVFVPALPIVPIALVVIAIFTVLNILGVNQVGNTQVVLGGLLLLFITVYIVAGLLLPGGFRWDILTAGGSLFISPGVRANLARLLATIALIYNAYVGFEVIADDAEEVRDPARTIPRSILISLTVIMVVYTLVTLVTLGTLPWQQLAGSETALTDAVRRFLPGVGVPMMAVAGLIATLTSVNTAMLSATREAFSMSRDGAWPRVLSKLGRFRTPYVAILAIGVIVGLVASVGLVDFLSYISSSGYLFVLFWASLALVRLRKKHPDLKRPFKVPFFPLTPYLAAASCFLIIAFTERRALLFGAGVLAICSIFYYLYRPFGRFLASRAKALEEARDRILIPVANPSTAESLVHLGVILAQASEDTSVCVLTVVPTAKGVREEFSGRLVSRLGPRQQALLQRIAATAVAKNVPLYTKVRAAPSVAQGVLNEIENNVKLVLMGWPGPLDTAGLSSNAVKVLLQKAHAHIAVLLDRGLTTARHILVPVGGGPHSRLAIRLAYEIAEEEGAALTALHCFCEECEAEELEDRIALLREIVEDVLGNLPARITLRLAHSGTVCAGILDETSRQYYDLVVVGASEEWADPKQLFGAVDDEIAEQCRCSVLMVRRYEHAAISWIRRRTKKQAVVAPSSH
jgi:APA family basic amino acid/polyamine antiporter